MKKLGFVLLSFVVVLFSGALFIYLEEGAVAFSTKVVNVGETQSVNGTNISQLEISSNSTDVKVVPYGGSEILVEFKGKVSEKLKDAHKLAIIENEDQVQIKLKRSIKPTFTLFAINKKAQLTVQVPKKLYNMIKVETSSGDIHISELDADNMIIQASSGDIFAKSLEGEEIAVETSSGDIDFDTDSDLFALDGRTNSGDATVTIPGMLFEVKSEDRVIGEFENAKYTLKIQTSSGDFKLY